MLTSEQIDQYRRDGYTVAPNLLNAAEVADLVVELDGICAGNTLAEHSGKLEMEPNQAPDGTVVRRLYEPCTYYPTFEKLSESPKLLDCIEGLIGPDILRHYSKINMKPAEIGSVVEWHQDMGYYPLTNGDSLAALMYLDDTTVENGCLQVIPGVHEQPLMDHTVDGFFQGKITEPVDESGAVPLEGEAGSVIFMHAMTPHASITNTSQKPRRTLIVSYRASDSYQLFCGATTADRDHHEKVVRGIRRQVARITYSEFPIPKQRQTTASLYELQEQSREQ